MARLVDLALIVPIEVSGRLVDAVPAVVDKVPAAAERVRREIVLARFLGKLAVDQGVRELRSRLTQSDDAATTAPAGVRTPAPPLGPGDSPADSAADAAAIETALAPVPAVAVLALADYDHLSSAQIVGKLEGLEPAERDDIELYERAGRHRRTVLGKLDQLRANEHDT